MRATSRIRRMGGVGRTQRDPGLPSRCMPEGRRPLLRVVGGRHPYLLLAGRWVPQFLWH